MKSHTTFSLLSYTQVDSQTDGSAAYVSHGSETLWMLLQVTTGYAQSSYHPLNQLERVLVSGKAGEDVVSLYTGTHLISIHRRCIWQCLIFHIHPEA